MTYKLLAANFHLKGMKNTIMDYIRHCDVCQRNKYQALSPAGLLQTIPIPKVVQDDIFLGFISSLPHSQGFDVILVIVDHLSKYVNFLSLKHSYTTHIMAQVFSWEVAKLHRFPKSIISDRDSLFLSKFWSELLSPRNNIEDEHDLSPSNTRVKQRLLIDVQRATCVVSLLNNQQNGIFGFLGQSIGTILPSTQPQERLLSRSLMDEHLHLCFVFCLERHPLIQQSQCWLVETRLSTN